MLLLQYVQAYVHAVYHCRGSVMHTWRTNNKRPGLHAGPIKEVGNTKATPQPSLCMAVIPMRR